MKPVSMNMSSTAKQIPATATARRRRSCLRLSQARGVRPVISFRARRRMSYSFEYRIWHAPSLRRAGGSRSILARSAAAEFEQRQKDDWHSIGPSELVGDDLFQFAGVDGAVLAVDDLAAGRDQHRVRRAALPLGVEAIEQLVAVERV